MKCFISILLLISFSAWGEEFPSHWWAEVPRTEAAGWEVLPQDAGPGEVILSKRNELGIFSNFGATPFELDGIRFGSIEGLWQSLKYPDPQLAHDSRFQIKDWPYSRAQVELMVGFEAKKAGNLANQIYKNHQLVNVSWQHHFFNYVDFAEGSSFHYQLITRALKAKLDQNAGLWDLLLKTRCLRLSSDHRPGPKEPPSFRYFEILMLLRNQRLKQSCTSP